MKPVWVLSQCGPKGELLPHPNLPGCEVYQGPSFKQMLVPTWDLQGHVDGFGIREGGAGGGAVCLVYGTLMEHRAKRRELATHWGPGLMSH